MKIKTQSWMIVSTVFVALFVAQSGLAGERPKRAPAVESRLEKLRHPRWSYTTVGSQGLSLPKKLQNVSRSPASSRLGPINLDREQAVVPISFYGSLSRLK